MCNRIPKGDMKRELNQTKAIYPQEGPTRKVCVITALRIVMRPGLIFLYVNIFSASHFAPMSGLQKDTLFVECF